MKRVWWVLLLLLAAVGSIGWWAVQSVQTAPELGIAQEEENLPPASYPADFAERLGRLRGVNIVLSSEREIPKNLAWRSGKNEPPLGDSRAVRGGTVRLASPGPYPDNLLVFGSPTPQFLHANIFERVEMPLIEQHPATRRPIPGVAEAWAVQGRTVYFRLHPAARYTNGRSVRAGDYALGALLGAEAGDAGWETLCRAAEELRVHGDSVVALTLREEGPLPELRASGLLHAAEPGFYVEVGDDYAERYAWRVPPTTGAYSVRRVEKGRMVELRRVRHWWAEDLPQRRGTCNVDAVQYYFLTDEAQAWEFLLRGKLDLVQTRHIASWHRYEHTPGLERIEYDTDTPQPPYGVALNARTIPELAVRRGLSAALDMDRAIALIFRGEGRRLQSFFEGYGMLPLRKIQQYDPVRARQRFARAGYSTPGEDGILRRVRDGREEKLSFRFCYVPSEKVSALVEVLRESARACGAEIVAEPLPWQLCAQQVREGKHELTFWATVPAEPLPEPQRYFSSNARGDEAPFGLADAEMDAALRECNQARDISSFAAALEKVDRLICELAVWVPGWREDRVRVLHAPHLHFPKLPGRYYDVTDNHTFWCTLERRGR